MKVRISWPTTYVDLYVWIVYEDPKSHEATLFMATMNMTLMPGRDPLGQLGDHLYKLYAEPIQFEDCGYWDNVQDSNGTCTHPFDRHLRLAVPPKDEFTEERGMSLLVEIVQRARAEKPYQNELAELKKYIKKFPAVKALVHQLVHNLSGLVEKPVEPAALGPEELEQLRKLEET